MTIEEKYQKTTALLLAIYIRLELEKTDERMKLSVRELLEELGHLGPDLDNE